MRSLKEQVPFSSRKKGLARCSRCDKPKPIASMRMWNDGPICYECVVRIDRAAQADGHFAMSAYMGPIDAFSERAVRQYLRKHRELVCNEK